MTADQGGQKNRNAKTTAMFFFTMFSTSVNLCVEWPIVDYAQKFPPYANGILYILESWILNKLNMCGDSVKLEASKQACGVSIIYRYSTRKMEVDAE